MERICSGDLRGWKQIILGWSGCVDSWKSGFRWCVFPYFLMILEYGTNIVKHNILLQKVIYKNKFDQNKFD